MPHSRRRFLRSAALIPALGAGSALAGPAQTPAGSSFDPWVEIRTDHLRHNIAEISRRVEGRAILAVAKNNGYGLGVANVARALEGVKPVAGVAVVKLDEALAIRAAGIRLPILLMGPFDERNLADAVERDIMPMVYTPIGPALDAIAARRQKPVALHICVDTGIGRVGVPFREAPNLVRDLARRKSVTLRGVMMTFAEDDAFDKEQLRRFEMLVTDLAREGITIGARHAASSFGLFQHPDAFLDMVRPGMAVYGVYSEPQFRGTRIMDLRPAVALRARVAYVKQLQAGDSAGYNRAYMAQRPVWIATLPVGHADGLPRVAAKGGRVRINGRMYPIVASVSASHTIVEIGDERRVEIGDVATIFDWEDGSRPEDLAESCGSSVYDLTMHLNALLPRRVMAG
jgi:alanine racemase